MAKPQHNNELLPGTLDLLILKILSRSPMHGYGIAERIRKTSDEFINVEEGSLYPALQRLELQGWVSSEWGRSENNRRAHFYRLTRGGRKQLGLELSYFGRMVAALNRVIERA
jgi:transcriptional regulator